MTSSEGLLPQSVLRAAGDKLYERRKTAALEVEQIVKSLDAQVTLPGLKHPDGFDSAIALVATFYILVFCRALRQRFGHLSISWLQTLPSLPKQTLGKVGCYALQQLLWG